MESSPTRKSTPISTSTPPPYTRSSSRLADPAKPSPSPLRLQQLLLLPSSPNQKPKPSQKTTNDDDVSSDAPAVAVTPGRRGKGRAAVVLSPRNTRRARRRLDREIEVFDEEGGKVRRRRGSRKVSNKDKSSFVENSVPDLSMITNAEIPVENNDNRIEGMWEQLVQLVMWKNVAKSSLWFGIGSMFILSSCFSGELSFSVVSAICQLGLLILGVAFLKDTVPPKQELPKGNFQLTEDNIVCVAQTILPVVNTILAKTQELLCGEPLMTLKVAPVLLLGAKYGHLVTFWRLFSAGFFISFTVPRLYSSYSEQVQVKVESIKDRAQEAWETCPRKKFVAAAVTILFWNIFTVKTRIFAAFMSVVILRYHHQRVSEEKVTSDDKNEMEQEAVIVEDSGHI